MSRTFRTRQLDQVVLSTEVAHLLPSLAGNARRFNDHHLRVDHHGTSFCPECLGPKGKSAVLCLGCTRKGAAIMRTKATSGHGRLSVPRDLPRAWRDRDTAAVQTQQAAALQSSRYVHAEGTKRSGPPMARMIKQADGTWEKETPNDHPQ